MQEKDAPFISTALRVPSRMDSALLEALRPAVLGETTVAHALQTFEENAAVFQEE